jgi:hypothetical protein
LLEDKGVTERLLEKSFNRLWSELEAAIEKAKTELAGSTVTEDSVTQRTEREILEETLEIVRRLSQQPPLRSYYETSVKPILDLGMRMRSDTQPMSITPLEYLYELSVNNFNKDNYNAFLISVAGYSKILWHEVSSDNKSIKLILAEELSQNLVHVLADSAGLDIETIQ